MSAPVGWCWSVVRWDWREVADTTRDWQSWRWLASHSSHPRSLGDTGSGGLFPWQRTAPHWGTHGCHRGWCEGGPWGERTRRITHCNTHTHFFRQKKILRYYSLRSFEKLSLSACAVPLWFDHICLTAEGNNPTPVMRFWFKYCSILTSRFPTRALLMSETSKKIKQNRQECLMRNNQNWRKLCVHLGPHR